MEDYKIGDVVELIVDTYENDFLLKKGSRGIIKSIDTDGVIRVDFKTLNISLLANEIKLVEGVQEVQDSELLNELTKAVDDKEIEKIKYLFAIRLAEAKLRLKAKTKEQEDAMGVLFEVEKQIKHYERCGILPEDFPDSEGGYVIPFGGNLCKGSLFPK